MTTTITYKGRKWTCDEHHAQIENLIREGRERDAKALVQVLDPAKSHGLCSECRELWEVTPASCRND